MGFLIPAGTHSGTSPDEITRKRAIADALLGNAMQNKPMQHPLEGVGDLGEAFVSALINRRATRDERAGKAGGQELIAKILQGQQPQTPGQPPMAGPSPLVQGLTGGIGSDATAQQPSAFRSAIAGIESAGSGDYKALGPPTKSGDRAYGRYQVMGANIPQWTREALGREMSPEEFLNSPEAQDAVFDHRFGSYVAKTGSPQDAASMWFTGRPQAQSGNAQDSLGTTGDEYMNKFNAAIGGQPSSQVQSAGFGDTAAPQGDQSAIIAALLGNEYIDPGVKSALMARLMPAPSDPFTLGQGDVRFSGSGRELARGAPKTNEPPAGVQEYEYAKAQGYPGSFADWEKENKGGTTVNVGPTGIDYGKPEDGLAWKRDKDGKVVIDERGAPIAIPYQGGKPYLAEQSAAAKAGMNSDQSAQTSDIVTQDVDRAAQLIKNNPRLTTGLFGQMLQSVGGFQANDARSLIDTVKANVGFDRLQQMRNASPTGGALGPVSDFENRMLQSVVGSLDQSQTSGQLLFNLERVKTIYEKIINEGIKEGDPMPGMGPSEAGLPEGVTEEDIQHTLQLHPEMTREKLLETLRSAP